MLNLQISKIKEFDKKHSQVGTIVLIWTVGLLAFLAFASTAKACDLAHYAVCSRMGIEVVAQPVFVRANYGGYYGSYGARGYKDQIAQAAVNVATGELYRSAPVAAGMLGNVLVAVVGRTTGAAIDAVLPTPTQQLSLPTVTSRSLTRLSEAPTGQTERLSSAQGWKGDGDIRDLDGSEFRGEQVADDENEFCTKYPETPDCDGEDGEVVSISKREFCEGFPSHRKCNP